MAYYQFTTAVNTLDLDKAISEYVKMCEEDIADYKRYIDETDESLISLELELDEAIANNYNTQHILDKIEQYKNWQEHRHEKLNQAIENMKPENATRIASESIERRKAEMEAAQKWKDEPIQMGETYVIDPVNKKSFIETQQITGTPLQLDDDVVEDEEVLCEVWDCYRGGSISVTPETEEEVKRLQAIKDNPGKYDFDTREWQSAYLEHSWDGGCDFGMDLQTDDFDESEIMEAFHEQSDYYSVAEFIEDLFNRELLTHDKISYDTYYTIYGCEVVPETRW